MNTTLLLRMVPMIILMVVIEIRISTDDDIDNIDDVAVEYDDNDDSGSSGNSSSPIDVAANRN